MGKMFDEALIAKLRKDAIIAVLVIDDAEQAVPLAKALLRGGVSNIELTLRTPVAFDAARRIARETPEIGLGIGTILNREQVRLSKEQGAAFGVSPGLNETVLKAAKDYGLPFAPGVMTPSEIEKAYEWGCEVMKLFPAEPAGGISYLKAVNAPYEHLNIKFIPLGGVSLSNLAAYLEFPAILAVGGSWLAPRKLIQEKAWDQISKNCEEACAIIRKVRG
jgi:2-dehydro-3-deoxyphosphogluconate aldolase/(4S)-4-hydroxy-2-oxoglutarate aldolase